MELELAPGLEQPGDPEECFCHACDEARERAACHDEWSLAHARNHHNRIAREAGADEFFLTGTDGIERQVSLWRYLNAENRMGYLGFTAHVPATTSFVGIIDHARVSGRTGK